MKKLVLLTLMLLTFFGCETEPIDPAILDNLNQQSFQVSVDGELFTSENASAVISNGQITITANSDSSTAKIKIEIASTQAGTYTNEVLASYSPTGQGAFSFVNLSETPNGFQNTGVFVISNINQNTQMISGTFQFVGYWSDIDAAGDEFQPVTLSSGIFNIPFTTDNIDPVDPTTGDLVAKVDGVQFTASEVVASFENPALPFGGPQFSIAGSNGTEVISLLFEDSDQPFIFPTPFGQVTVNYLPVATNPLINYSNFNPTSPNSVVGNLTITEHDPVTNKISGTFQVVLFKLDTTGNFSESVQLTEGAFTNITYVDNTD